MKSDETTKAASSSTNLNTESPPPSPSTEVPHLLEIDPKTGLYTPNVSEVGNRDLFRVLSGECMGPAGLNRRSITFELLKATLAGGTGDVVFSDRETGAPVARVEVKRLGEPITTVATATDESAEVPA